MADASAGVFRVPRLHCAPDRDLRDGAVNATLAQWSHRNVPSSLLWMRCPLTSQGHCLSRTLGPLGLGLGPFFFLRLGGSAPSRSRSAVTRECTATPTLRTPRAMRSSLSMHLDRPSWFGCKAAASPAQWSASLLPSQSASESAGPPASLTDVWKGTQRNSVPRPRAARASVALSKRRHRSAWWALGLTRRPANVC